MFTTKSPTTPSIPTTLPSFSSTPLTQLTINQPTNIITSTTIIRNLPTSNTLLTNDNLSPNKQQQRPFASTSSPVIRPAAFISYQQQQLKQLQQLQSNKNLLSPPLNLSTSSTNTPTPAKSFILGWCPIHQSHFMIYSFSLFLERIIKFLIIIILLFKFLLLFIHFFPFSSYLVFHVEVQQSSFSSISLHHRYHHHHYHYHFYCHHYHYRFHHTAAQSQAHSSNSSTSNAIKSFQTTVILSKPALSSPPSSSIQGGLVFFCMFVCVCVRM